MSTLYELNTEFQNLLRQLEEEDLTQEAMAEIAQQLSELNYSLEDKCLNTVKIIKGFEAEAEIIKAEEERLNKRRKALQAKADWLKGGIKGTMEVNGIEKIKGALHTISLSKPQAGSVSINVPVEQLPDEYKIIKVEVDKTSLKNDLKAGVYIEGVELEEVRKLTIR